MRDPLRVRVKGKYGLEVAGLFLCRLVLFLEVLTVSHKLFDNTGLATRCRTQHDNLEGLRMDMSITFLVGRCAFGGGRLIGRRFPDERAQISCSRHF